MRFIKKIRIKNFKSLEDVEIEFKTLTFLFGPNGSGKSSFMKALLFFYKNVFPVNKSQTLYKLSNELDLGSFDECVINGDRKKDIEFEFTIEHKIKFPDKRLFDIENYPDYLESKEKESPIYFGYVMEYINSLNANFFEEYSRIDNLDDPFYAEFTDKYSSDYEFAYNVIFLFKYNESGKNLYSIHIKDNSNENSIEYKIQDNFSAIFNLKDNNEYLQHFLNSCFKNNFCGDHDFPFINKNEFIEGELHPFIRDREKEKKIVSEWLSLNFEKRIEIYYDLLKFTYTAIDLIPKCFIYILDLFHLPIIREIPRPKYLLINNKFNSDEYYGFLDNLYKSNTKINGIKVNYISDNINELLKIIGIDKKLNLYINKDIGYIYFYHKSKKKINLANESSGLIQILPILISLCIKPKYPFIMIEQPELHLHPKLQSRLADVFIKSLNDRNEPNTIMIETHSEHLIRKIQVLIANGELSREKVSVLYFDNNQGLTKIKEMEIDENGLFKEDWPNGFFDDSVNLTMELFDAIRKRKN